MASKASRWAVSEEEAARAKQEREAKRRLKADKAARRAESERQAAAKAAAAAAQARSQAGGRGDGLEGVPEGGLPPQNQQSRLLSTEGAAQDDDRRPAKRRRVTPAPDGAHHPPDRGGDGAANGEAERQLLRFHGGTCAPCRSVENYDKLNDIEEGAYGWVARARELATGRVVALKRLKMDPKDRSGLPVTGLREMQLLRDCRHRNVVEMLEVVVGEDTSRIENVFLVFEFFEHDLRSILEDMPEPFLASEVKTLLLQLASGVAYLHDNWILHRDLKTANLLLNNRGQLKIADFGMARYVGDPPPKLTQLVVTLWYRAPELLLGAERYGRAVDMWSVGCIFGELLTREPLLRGKNEVDELARIFELCGVPTDESWPGFRRLPNARPLRLPKAPHAAGSVIRARFPLLTAAGSDLLTGLLTLDPDRRLSARDMLAHEYFRQDPRPKQEAMFPTFPSKAGQERRRRKDTPPAPARGQAAADFAAADFSGIFGGLFAGREKEEKGAGFSLRMV